MRDFSVGRRTTKRNACHLGPHVLLKFGASQVELQVENTPASGEILFELPDKNLMRFFPVLLRELLADFMDFDSRVMRTLKPLLFRPGKLTRDYLDGRRFRYVPPLRLYIFSSLAFFFLAALLTTDAIGVSADRETSGPGIYIQLDEDEKRDVDAALEELSRVCPAFVACYPNAGLPDEEGEYTLGPEGLAASIRRFCEEGWLNLVGGCCGTTPAHIEAMARQISSSLM